MTITPRNIRLQSIAVVLLATLCVSLGVIQYRWIGELATAEQGRLREDLRTRLGTFADRIDGEVSETLRLLVPSLEEIRSEGAEKAYAEKYYGAQASVRSIVLGIALAIPRDGEISLETLDPVSHTFEPSAWPPKWNSMHADLEHHLNGRGGRGPGASGLLFEIPRFAEGREQEWLVIELDGPKLCSALFQDEANRLRGVREDYDLDVVEDAGSGAPIWRSAPPHPSFTAQAADASVSFLDLHFAGPPMPPGARPREGAGPGPRQPGRLRILARSRAGSLETLVTRVRRRNLVISGAILLIIAGTGAMLARLSRQSAQLAHAHLNFVAGVSHELRTPITVIRTAAYNLRNRSFAGQPERLERYGKLIEDEAGKLDRLVAQVLQFASAGAGHVVRGMSPVSIAELIEREVNERRESLGSAAVRVDTKIEPGLRPVMADPEALRQAIGNLVDNAAKYGKRDDQAVAAIEIMAESIGGQQIRISVTDHGPGIPAEEMSRIFEPFFRGRRALADQTRGTGLGLNLVRQIVNAHGGEVRVKSEPGFTQFIVEIPAPV